MPNSLTPEQVLQQLRDDHELAKTLNYDGIFTILEKYSNNEVLIQMILRGAENIAHETTLEMKGLLFGMLRMAHVEANRYLDAEKQPRYLKITTLIKNALKGQFRLNSAVPVMDQAKLDERIQEVKAMERRLGRSIPHTTPDGGVIHPLGEMGQDAVATDIKTGHLSWAADRLNVTLKITRSLKTAYEQRLESPSNNQTENLWEYLGVLSALAILLMRQSQAEGSLMGFAEALTTWNLYYDTLLGEDLPPVAQEKNLNYDRAQALTKEAFLGAVVYPQASLRERWQVFKQARQTISRAKTLQAAFNPKWIKNIFG